MPTKTREQQYTACLELRDRQGIAPLGIVTNLVWHENPRHLVFMLSRYKFVAKMLEGRQRVLEVGCGDAFASRIVRQTVGSLTAVDFDPAFIDDANARADAAWPIDLRVHDILEAPVAEMFDAAYSIDVLEHIEPCDEHRFLENIAASLTKDAILVVGTPTLESQVFASPRSKAGHVNCKTAPDLQRVLRRYFRTVFIYSMNDEVVHTGFHKMAHYLLALCCSKRA